MIKGVMFDFDGTIVDSEVSRFKSSNEVLKKFNIGIFSLLTLCCRQKNLGLLHKCGIALVRVKTAP